MFSRIIKLLFVVGFGIYTYGLAEDEKKRRQLTSS
jgi:hypothetical protein